MAKGLIKEYLRIVHIVGIKTFQCSFFAHQSYFIYALWVFLEFGGSCPRKLN